MKYWLLFTILIFHSIIGNAQNYDCELKRNWFFGKGLTPAGASNGQSIRMQFDCGMNQNLGVAAVNSANGYGFEGTGVVNNYLDGSLVFYSDGNNLVYNSGPVPQLLGGHSSSAQSVAFAPIRYCPLDSLYVFSNGTGSGQYTTISYVRMNLNGDMSTSDVIPYPPATDINGVFGMRHGEGMIVVPSTSTIGEYWLITRVLKNNGSQSTDAVVVYKVTNTDITIHQVFDANLDGDGNIATSVFSVAYTNFHFNRERKELLIADGNTSKSVVAFEFNTSTGIIGDELYGFPVHTAGSYDVQFSPNNNILYYTAYGQAKLYAYNIETGVHTLILTETGNSLNRSAGLGLGPDGNIYCNTYSTSNWVQFNSKVWQVTNPNNPSPVASPFSIHNNFLLGNLPQFIVPPIFEVAVLSGNNTLCQGDSLMLFIEGFSHQLETIRWFKDGVEIEQSNNDTMWVSETGSYYASIESVNNCIYESNVMDVSVSPELNVNLLSKNCIDNSIELNVEVCNLSDFTLSEDVELHIYGTNPLLESANSIQSNTQNLNLESGECLEFMITIPDASSYDSLYFFLNHQGGLTTPINFNQIQTSINECNYSNNYFSTVANCCELNFLDTNVCFGDDLIIESNNNLTWSYSSDFSDTIVFGNNLSISEVEVPVSIYTSFNEGNCNELDSFDVYVKPKPEIFEMNSDTLVCEGTFLLLNASATVGADLTWNETIPNQTEVELTTSLTYQVEANLDGCVVSDSFEANTYAKPELTLSYILPKPCDSLNGVIYIEPASFYPFTVSHNNTIINSNSIEFLNAGNYQFDIIDSLGCANSGSVQVQQSEIDSINEGPNFALLPNNVVLTESFVNCFQTTGFGDSNYWFVDNELLFSNETNIQFNVGDESGEKTICLLVYKGQYCSDTICKSLVIEDDLLYFIPNTFTPNGDDYNEVFQVVFSNLEFVENFRLEVWNRWGELIYESEDKEGFWDGKYRGRLVQDGVYVWNLVYKFDGKLKQATGHITVLR